LPLTLPASAARTNPAPMDAATSITVTDCSNLRSEPSGKRTIVTNLSFKKGANYEGLYGLK
jgi:hypothetical protein